MTLASSTLPPRFELLPPEERWMALSGRDKEVYNVAGLSYHSEMIRVATLVPLVPETPANQFWTVFVVKAEHCLRCAPLATGEW